MRPVSRRWNVERTIKKELLTWKNRPDRRPLLITGVRQCGKTYVMKEFAQEQFEKIAYLNLEKEERAAELFAYDFDPKRILRELGAVFFGFEITPGSTVLILDEIQSCPRAIASLKYFCEDLPELHVMCAGSLLGVELKHQNISFPVGKIDRLQMFPMSFAEFLAADDGMKYLTLAQSRPADEPIPELCRVPLEKAYRQYLIVGGMPAAVKTWIQTHSFQEVERVQDGILSDYADDFSKHAPPAEVPKIHWVWDSVPKQLARDNNKFVFSHVREGKRASELENALTWLKDAGLVYLTELVENPELPLSFCSDASYFKVYMADIGLLRRKAGVYFDTILDENENYIGFKGALAENYVQNELKNLGYQPYFWRSGNQAEVDFLIERKGMLIPIEVKSAANTRAKSYRLFCKRYSIRLGFKLSLKNRAVNEEDGTRTVSLPLYLISDLESSCQDQDCQTF